MSIFTAESISAGYGGKSIINNVSFSLEGGCLTGVLGANGSGKTTLLKALCGIIPHSGKCTLDGVSLEALSAKRLAQLVSYIPQRSGITIDISALDVVLMGFNPRLGLLEQPSKQMKSEAVEALSAVGLAGRENTNYLHLSEGQKQLSILARTLVSGSRLLLLDEPESALDFSYRHQMLGLLRGWLEREKGGAVVALHDPLLALNYCDRLLIISEGGLLGAVEPETDPIDKTEKMLSMIYGDISLQRCQSRSGKTHIVMLKEE